jgi:signal peptidase II
MSKKKIFWIVVLLLVIDQAVKIWIKTHMSLGESIAVFPGWFFIHFLENFGAAWGMHLGGPWGKLLLSLFRVVLSGVLVWYIVRLVQRKAPTGVVVGFALILAGAMGNIFDSAFYGLIFSESTYGSVAHFVPWGEGYATFLHGGVVDMFYFPLIRNSAGEVVFFSPVFNVADSYISIGVIYLLLFKYKYFNK